jgi:hypothetical protein
VENLSSGLLLLFFIAFVVRRIFNLKCIFHKALMVRGLKTISLGRLKIKEKKSKRRGEKQSKTAEK